MKGIPHHGLAVYGQRSPCLCGLIHAHTILRTQPLQHLVAGQAALTLGLIHTVDVVQLLNQPLLLAGRQFAEAGIIAQNLFLVLHGRVAMIV